MKYLLPFLLLLNSFISAQTGYEQFPNELFAVSTTQVNRLPMHAEFFRFEDRQKALQNNREKSSLFMSLNGTWRFNWVSDPRQRPQDFYKTDFNDQQKGWVNFAVPANWEVNGYGYPVYVNHPYDFTGRSKMGARLNPPYDIPVDHNPVGSYRRTFTLPENWDGKQIFINLDGVKTAFYLWINGQKVGYSEDYKLAAEFDITKYVKKGHNVIALQVFAWADSSYLECQDMIRYSGIERGIYLYATPKTSITDYKVSGSLDRSYRNGVFDLSVKANNYEMDKGLHAAAKTYAIDVQLLDTSGKSVFEESKKLSVINSWKNEVKFSKTIPEVKTWSAETPYRYLLIMTLRDEKGNVLQAIPQYVGFRSVEIRGSDMLVNGKRVFFKGVNRHEAHPTKGHVLSHAEMEKDMEMMKKLNVNAVRHSHYPPDPYWMELCDKYGLYVIDEANIESHGRGYDLRYTLANDPEWKAPHMDRITRMYERDKNYTAVITWSLGNEAGNGINMYDGYNWLKTHDFRPVQYERSELDFNTDIICTQYPTPDNLLNYSRSTDPSYSRPYIMSEYAHIMGNSLGNFKDYWDVIENNPKLQGGYIWEWVDQGIDTIKNGKRILAYGGDFPLDHPVDPVLMSDNNFNVKGLVTGYRALTPMAVEAKKVHQNIKTQWDGAQQFTVRNGYFFRDLSNYKLLWKVTKDGKTVKSGSINSLQAQPGEVMPLNINLPQMNRNSDYFISFSYLLKAAEPFLEAGYEIAAEQFQLKNAEKTSLPVSAKGTTAFDNNYNVTGKDFKISFDADKGVINRYEYKNSTYLSNAFVPSYWRAPVDNDFGAGLNRSARKFRDAYAQGKVIRKNISQSNSTTVVEFEKEVLGGDALQQVKYTVYPDGTVDVYQNFKVVKGDSKFMQRAGSDAEMNPAFDKIEFFGRGPWENYKDRKYASEVGIYRQNVADQYFPYARPQESGNKTDVRWVQFTDKSGRGIRFEAFGNNISFSALPYALKDLDPETEKKQYHSGELEKRDKIYLHIDHDQSGVGGVDSWATPALGTYRIPYRDYSYTYRMIPLK